MNNGFDPQERTWETIVELTIRVGETSNSKICYANNEISHDAFSKKS